MATKETKKLRKENEELKIKLARAKYVNTGILRRWKANFKKAHIS